MTTRGFSFTELLVALVLSSVLGMFAYKFMTSTTSVQVNQRYVAEYRNIAAVGLDAMRRELQSIDVSLLRAGMPTGNSATTMASLKITANPNGPDTTNANESDTLSFVRPIPDRPLFTLNMARDLGNAEAGINQSPSSYYWAYPLEKWVTGWPVYCNPISPPVSATKLSRYSSAPQEYYLLWGPGVSLLAQIRTAAGYNEICHTDVNGKVDGVTGLGMYPDLAQNYLNYYRDVRFNKRYIPAGALTARAVKYQKFEMAYATTGMGATMKHLANTGAIYLMPQNTAAFLKTLLEVPAIPATTVRYSFDIDGVEQAAVYPSTADITKIDAINVRISGRMQTRSKEGTMEFVDVPLHMKVKLIARSSTIQDPIPTDKKLLTPNLTTIANRGVGQPVVDEADGTPYLYVPTTTLATPFSDSTGYVTVLDPSDWSVKADIPLQWTFAATTYNFIPTKIVSTSAGLVIGGYTQTGCPGACVRQAVLFHLPRLGGLPANRIDWAAAPTYQWMGDELGNQVAPTNDPGRALAEHKYYMADTVHVAVHEDTIYWGSYTHTSDPAVTLNSFWDRTQIYKTTLASPAIGPTYEIVHEFSKSGYPNLNVDTWGRELSGLAINSTGDHLYTCFDGKGNNAASGCADEQGSCMVGNPLTAVNNTTGESGSYTPEIAKLGSWGPFVTLHGSVTGMDVDGSDNLFVGSRWNFHHFPQAYADAIRDLYVLPTATSGQGNRVSWLNVHNLTTSTCYGAAVNYATEYNVAQEFMSPEAQAAGYSSYVLKGILGFGIQKSITNQSSMYFLHIPAPGDTPTASIGRFAFQPLIADSRRVTSVTTGSGWTASTSASISSMSRPQETMPQNWRLLPITGYNATTNLIMRNPLNCRRYGATPDTWDTCVKRKLGGVGL